MAAGTLSKGFLALVMTVFSCFPTAKENPKPSVVKEGDFQCISCSMPKRNITVICGGGVVGLLSVYWLSRMQEAPMRNIIILEARN
jgi:hypothetical protein